MKMKVARVKKDKRAEKTIQQENYKIKDMMKMEAPVTKNATMPSRKK